MLTTLAIATLLASGSSQAPTISCPVMGAPAVDKGPVTDYAGVRYRFCCAGCDVTFGKGPASALKGESVKGKVTGVSLFDPVQGLPINRKGKGGFSDFGGTRFYFLNGENKAKFDADPKRYGTAPEKEALFCPVMRVELKNYYGVAGFVDHDGVRYYACCGSCLPTLKGDVAKYAPNAAAYVKAPRSFAVNEAIAKITGAR